MTSLRPASSLRVLAVVLLLALTGLSLPSLRSAPPPDLSTWLQPVPASAVFQDPDYNIWCGSAVVGPDGQVHLFYSRWPRRLGHLAWVTHSEIARAVAPSPLGPFRHVEVVLPARGPDFWDGHCTHNPTVLKHEGKYYLYYMGNAGDGRAMSDRLNFTHRNRQRIGVAVADRPEGPWKRFDRPVLDVDPRPEAPDSLVVTNPSVTLRPDGTVLMIYKAVGQQKPLPFGGPVVHLAATARSPLGPFTKHSRRIFTREGATFPAEDPFIWHDGSRYLGIVKDMGGHFTGRGVSLALFVSDDGLDWSPAPRPLVSTLILPHSNGRMQTLQKLERPQLLLIDGHPAVLYCAAVDTPDLNGSFNVAIPLAPPAP